jgi:hypothetical protein
VHYSRLIVIVVVVVLWGLMTHSTYAGTGDEPHYVAIAHSIAFDGDLDLSNNYGASEPLLAEGSLHPDVHAMPDRHGVLRPVHDIGMAVLFAPYAAVARPVASALVQITPPAWLRSAKLTPSVLYRHLLSVAMIATTVILTLSMRRLGEAAGATSRTATVSALLIALSPPLLIHGILFFTEVTSALLCTFAVLLLTRSEPLRPRLAALTATAVGFLVLVHIRNIGLAGALAAALLWRLGREHRHRELGLAAFVMASGVLVRMWLSWSWWGSPLTSPHARLGEWSGWPSMWAEVGRRAAGLLIDQEFGVLIYFPALLLVGFGFRLLWRQNRRLVFVLIMASGAYLVAILLPTTNPHGWTGGWSPVARFLVPILPLMAAPLSIALQHLPRRVLVTAMALQLLINMYFWSQPKNLWNDADGVAAVCQRSGAAFCKYLPTLVTADEARLAKPPL